MTVQNLQGSSSHPTGRAGDVKLYAIVSDGLRRQIRSGARKPGDRLPSMDRLAAEFGVSLITVRKAVELLENEGLLERQQGRGTFVARTANAREWLRLSTTWSDLMHGYEKTLSMLENEVVLLKEDEPVPLQHDEGQEPPRLAASYVFMRRLHRVDGVRYAYTDLHLDESVFRMAPEAFTVDMVLRVLSRLDGLAVGAAFQTLTIGAADQTTADLLGVPVGSPVGELLRTVLSANGTLVYRGEVIYRGDLVRVDTRLL